MSKALLAADLYKNALNAGTKAGAAELVDHLFSTLKTMLKKTKRVYISGFGTFKVINRKARKARNPRTGETIRVPARRDIKFRASDSVKKYI